MQEASAKQAVHSGKVNKRQENVGVIQEQQAERQTASATLFMSRLTDGKRDKQGRERESRNKGGSEDEKDRGKRRKERRRTRGKNKSQKIREKR